jgi:DNA polymerase I-like protein with 3'-5' exonuclease and polymerase domains
MELQLPLFEPPTTWTPPTQLPDLSDAKEIAIDTENHDPLLKSKGPSFIRHTGRVAGISVASDTGFHGYFPVGHEGPGNLDSHVVSRWLSKIVASPHRSYVFANAQYDLGWLSTLGVHPMGRIVDIAIAATLLDEEASEGYSLNAIATRYTGKQKDETLLRRAATEYGLLDPKADLWRLPPRMVGLYAETDALRTLESWQVLKKLLADENLTEIFDLECRLTPILYRMWRRGIRIDLDFAEELNQRWQTEELELLQRLRMSIDDIWTPAVITTFCDKRGIKYPYTKPTPRFPQGQPSITKDFMENSPHPELGPLRKVRAINRTRQTFLVDTLLRDHIRGRIHPQYIQLASDDGGTRTGRLACRNPNAHQFPKRSTLFDSKSIRKCLLPEEGARWGKYDYWSQEPTFQCHYGIIMDYPGALQVRDQFIRKVKLYTFIEQATKGRCNYDQAKEVVLGRSYGMGKSKMSQRMGIDEAECDDILRAFDETVPYIPMLARSCANLAQQRGFIRTVLGRRRHFDFWVPRGSDGIPGRRRADAGKTWPGKPLERAFTYKAFNALIQGSAADQTKKALVDLDQAIGLPQMTVHDEISSSIQKEKDFETMGQIMRETIPLKCPVQTDPYIGPCWS